MHSVLAHKSRPAVIIACACCFTAFEPVNYRDKIGNARIVQCHEERSSSAQNTRRSPITSISWLQKTLFTLNISKLPLPRLIGKNDPDLSLSRRFIRQRQADERTVRELQRQVLQAIHDKNQQRVGELLKKVFQVLYGIQATPQQRQDFLQTYGCTGWTEPVLLALLELGQQRGFVEIGAGQGQWARVLSERYKAFDQHGNQKKQFDFVLAFDNNSALPLNPDIYHKKTAPHHQYFYDKVQHCDDLKTILSSWSCRGRVLLLVYPGPDDMAVEALTQYVQADPQRNDAVVYVGEGRGGANANDAFFDALEGGDWILEQIHTLRIFGDKGYEKLFIFRRRKE